jgi:hypothetical protein
VGGRTITLSLVALTLAVMSPRLLSAQFGLLDDGVTIHVSRALGAAFREGNPGLLLQLELDRGRFRPLYWLFEAFSYAVSGSSALGFFAVNGVVLLLTALLVARTVTIVTGDRLASLIAGVAYLLSPPIIESHYTLSKPEVPLALWLAVSLYGWAGAREAAERSPTRSRRLFALSAASLFLAYLTKETGLTMSLVSALSLIAPWLTPAISRTPGAERIDRWYFGVNVAWTAVFWSLRVWLGTASIAAGNDSQHYALTASSILTSAVGHGIWYLRDFPLLVPFLAFLWWRGARRTRLDPWLVLVPIFWIVSWTVIMLPWPTIYEYFLLPAALGIAIVTGNGVAAALRTLRAPERTARLVARVLLALVLVCTPVTLINMWTTAGIQLAIDAANAKLIDVLAAMTPAGGTVLVDLPPPNEYVAELALHLALLKDRGDVRVEYADRAMSPGDAVVLLASPRMRRRPLPGVRLPVPEIGSAHPADVLRARLGVRPVLVDRVTRRVRLLVTAVPGPICDVLASRQADTALFCTRRRAFLDRRTFEYGWEVYRVNGH